MNNQLSHGEIIAMIKKENKIKNLQDKIILKKEGRHTLYTRIFNFFIKRKIKKAQQRIKNTSFNL